jgi:TPR repeat protein
MKRLLTTLVVLTSLLGSGGAVWAQDLDKGAKAFKSGDYATALKEWIPLAEQGNLQRSTISEQFKLSKVRYNLGWMYYNGEGVTQDYAEAAKWFRKAAESGLQIAQHNIAVMYESGMGVTQDYAEAAKWYRKAAEHDFVDSMLNLGLMYFHGKGVNQDYVEAAKWFHEAAPHRAAEAMALLGVMYLEGKGVNQDKIASHMWLSIAAAFGNKLAPEARDRVADELSSSDLERSAKRAQRCMESGYTNC